MTRLNTNKEVFHDLRTVGFYKDSVTADSLSAAAVAGATSVSLVSVAGFVAGDIIRIGADGDKADVHEISAIASNTFTLKQPLAFAQVSGAVVTKLDFVDMGHTTDAGVTLETTQDETPLPSGIQVGVLLFIGGAVEVQFNFAMSGFNPENLAQAFGEDETDTGLVTTTPEGVILNPNKFGSLGEKPWKFEGLRDDGKTVTMHIFAGKVAAVNASINLTTGTAAEVPLQGRSTGAISIKIE